jgi:hypothetical protein
MIESWYGESKFMSLLNIPVCSRWKHSLHYLGKLEGETGVAKALKQLPGFCS